jgi:hypothetical protein
LQPRQILSLLNPWQTSFPLLRGLQHASLATQILTPIYFMSLQGWKVV